MNGKGKVAISCVETGPLVSIVEIHVFAIKHKLKDVTGLMASVYVRMGSLASIVTSRKGVLLVIMVTIVTRVVTVIVMRHVMSLLAPVTVQLVSCCQTALTTVH